MSCDNEAMVRRWFEEIWNQRRTEMVDEVLTAESVCHTGDGPVCGCEAFREQMYQPLTAAFPDLRVQIDALISTDDNVVVRWTARGTHRGEGLPLPPTNRPVAFSGITWLQIRDGKFQEGWQSSNLAEVLRCLADPQPVA